MDGKMNAGSLSNFYDELKDELKKNDSSSYPNMMKVGVGNVGLNHPGAIRWRNIAAKECDKLKDNCRKHILLDIYCKIIPLDDDYVQGNMGKMKSDIDAMLASKGMTATQYITSGYDQTKAPLLEYILRSTDMIGRQFMEESDKTLKDAQEKGIEVPEPIAPTEDDKDIENQLVDIKDDNEYSSFINKLKEKTINKIVKDVSDIINDKKEEKKMTFDPKPIADEEAEMESTVSIALNYLNQKLMTESIDEGITPSIQEEILGYAIREATLNQMDLVFNQKGSDFKSFASAIRYGKGALVNESAVSFIVESVKCSPTYESMDETKKIAEDIKTAEKLLKNAADHTLSDEERNKLLDTMEKLHPSAKKMLKDVINKYKLEKDK